MARRTRAMHAAIMGAVTGQVVLLGTAWLLIDRAADLESLSVSGMVHVGAAFVAFTAVVAAMLVLIWTFARRPEWRRLAPWFGLLASGAFALMFVQAPGPLFGLMQRALATIIAAWVVLAALRPSRLVPRDPADEGWRSGALAPLGSGRPASR